MHFLPLRMNFFMEYTPFITIDRGRAPKLDNPDHFPIPITLLYLESFIAFQYIS